MKNLFIKSIFFEDDISGRMHKQRFFKVFSFLFLLLGTIHIHSQSLIIQSTDGNESTKELSLLSKLSFLESNLVLSYVAGTNESIDVASISKLYFKDAPIVAGISSIQTASLIVFPNPVNSILNIQNIAANGTLVIYSIEGLLIKKESIYKGNTSLNVNNLKRGLYILKINNQTIKFNKL